MCVSALICATVCVKFNLQLEATKGQAKLKKLNQFCLFCVLVASTEKNTQVHLVALNLVIFSFSTTIFHILFIPIFLASYFESQW